MLSHIFSALEVADHHLETMRPLLHVDWEEECLGDQMVQYVRQGCQKQQLKPDKHKAQDAWHSKHQVPSFYWECCLRQGIAFTYWSHQ